MKRGRASTAFGAKRSGSNVSGDGQSSGFTLTETVYPGEGALPLAAG